jgi:hypothetical protein
MYSKTTHHLDQLLLAKDTDHLQSLITEQSLFTKPLFTNKELEDLCAKMVTVANSAVEIPKVKKRKVQ